MYKPADLFIGIVDFFAIMIPGGIFSFIIYNNHADAINGIIQLSNDGYWVAFLFFSFFLGHIFSFIAEKIDKLWSSNFWIDKNQGLWDTVFSIRKRIGQKSDSPEISIYQWCRSVLINVSPDAMSDINRIVASADFFRNLYVVFPLTGLLCLINTNYILGIVFIVFTIPCLYFSETGRQKLHKRICNHIIILDALDKLKPRNEK